MSRAFIGNSAVVDTLQKQLKNGTIHHANLVMGPKHVGKSTLVEQLILQALSSTTDIPVERHEALISSGAHSNVLRMQPNKNGAHTVEEARPVVRALSTTATLDTWRFVIIEHAEAMTPATANALLKVLEEPPKRTVWFLLTDNPDAVLATIQSRCAQFWLHRSSDNDILLHWPDLNGFHHLAEGLPGKAITLSQAGPQGIQERIHPWIAVCSASTLAERQQLSKGLFGKGTTRLQLIGYINDVVSVLRDAILQHEGMTGGMTYQMYAAELAAISRQRSVERLLTMIDQLQELRAKLAQPIQPKLAFTQLLIILSTR